jgi:type III pantothenate kinase
MHLLLLDIGNSRLNGGIFFGDKLISTFSIPSKTGASCNEYKQWFREVFEREYHKNQELISGVVVSSVVPEDTPVLLQACREFCSQAKTILELKPTETSIKLCCDNPSEVGADRVSAMLGARFLHSISSKERHRNMVIFDCGSATTAQMLTQDGEFVGGLIAPGLKTSLEALTLKASQLGGLRMDVVRPTKIFGTNTVDNIQAGIYYAALGLIKEVIFRLEQESKYSDWLVIGTGGFSGLFKEEKIFDIHEPNLVLWGLVAFWFEKGAE